VVAFFGLENPPRSLPQRDELPRDLLAVYWSVRKFAQRGANLVDVWEMVGEPDTAYCKDLPDHVAAFQKAVYLGIRDASPPEKRPGILMGALGQFPSPWLARAAANGLFDYTDGLNFHYYGQGGDLRGVIRAQRKFAKRFSEHRRLPLWITECGMDAVPAGNPADAHGRELQRKFTIETAAIAREERVAVFMPFVFVQRGAAHALVDAEAKPYPAWTDYARYTQSFELPPGPSLAPPRNPARLVLQWLPDRRTCIPQKVSGAYWFRGGAANGAPISGEIVAYNFSAKTIAGNVIVQAPNAVSMEIQGGSASNRGEVSVSVSAFSAMRIPVRLNLDRSVYFRGDVSARFVADDSGRMNSALFFGVATRPRDALLKVVQPLQVKSPGASFQWIWAPEPCVLTSRHGPWIGVNGVRVEPSAENGDASSKTWTFNVRGPATNATQPPMAIAAIDGLPRVKDGFLRLRVPEEFSDSMNIRVDLVDKRGQRFCVAENFGMNWLRPEPGLIYLSYEDFHIYQWGRCTDDPFFDPAAVREIQLRFFPSRTGGRIGVQLDVVSPGSASEYLKREKAQ
jgi:hypothetical protein